MQHRTQQADPGFSAPRRSTSEIVRRVARYLRPYPWLATATLACALVSLGASFAFPRLTQFIIDDVISRNRQDQLGGAIAALLLAFVARDAFNSLRIRINNILEQHVIRDMRCELYARLQRLPVGYFDQRASGDLMTRLMEDVNSVERLLIDGTEQGTVALLSIVGVMLILLWSHPLLAALALIPVPILAGGALWYTVTAHRRYRVQREAASAMNALLMDNLQGIRQIKAFGQETHEDERFAQRAEALRQGSLRIMLAWALYSPAMSLAAALGTVLVLGVGGQLVIRGNMSVGQLVGFLFYLALFYEPITRLHGLNQLLQAARAAGERVFDILDHTPERTGHWEAIGSADPAPRESADFTRSTPEGWRARGEVAYEEVGFEYAPGQTALHGIDLRATPGECLALVGPTGAGKSTLVHLLPRFYTATRGRITLDGRDILALDLEELRAQIAIVSQEPFLFNGTIGENILYGRLDATPAELEAAARAANAHQFILRQPQGYDTRVGERGVKLSVGEKQRVSIARALLKNAPVLILDEATASVDTVTERLIQEALARLMAGRTSFVIAHRLSTIRRADQILVLRQGTVVERGTHEQLMTSNGLYANLARVQNTTFIEEGFEQLAVS